MFMWLRSEVVSIYSAFPVQSAFASVQNFRLPAPGKGARLDKQKSRLRENHCAPFCLKIVRALDSSGGSLSSARFGRVIFSLPAPFCNLKERKKTQKKQKLSPVLGF